MKAINRWVLFVCWATIAFSCSGKLEQKEFVRWVTDYNHELHVKREVGDLVFDVQYTPTDYVWLQRTGGKHSVDGKREKQEISTLQYYTLTLRVKDGTDFMNVDVQDAAEKQRRLYYFSYQFQNDITVEDNGQVLPCVLFHSERPADQRHGRTFVLGFENPIADSQEAKLVITSEHLGSLPIKIKVSKKNIPSLSI